MCDEDSLIAVALAAGSTQDVAAAKAGVSRATITRRLQDPAFRELVAGYRREAVSQALGLIARALADAVAQLHLITTDGETEGNRLRAAVAVLEVGRKYLTDADLEERVRRLEEQADAGSGGAGRPAGEAAA